VLPDLRYWRDPGYKRLYLRPPAPPALERRPSHASAIEITWRSLSPEFRFDAFGYRMQIFADRLRMGRLGHRQHFFPPVLRFISNVISGWAAGSISRER
jgi:hypothetical protein